MFRNGNVSVRKDHRGLPTIIPSRLRHLLEQFDNGDRSCRRIIVCILTCLSIFRVFSVKVEPSLKSVCAPFKGSSQTLDLSLIKSALRQLPVGVLRIPKPKLLVLESASPNAQKSTWSASLDAIALIFYPKVYRALAIFCWTHIRGRWILGWILVLQVIAIPVIIFI